MFIPVSGDASHRWLRVEQCLCTVFLSSRLLLLDRTFGIRIGYDPGPHVQYMKALGWDFLSLGIKRGFYFYHPPLAFFSANALRTFGLTNVESVQVLNAASSLAAFFLLRWTLRHLCLLRRPVGIVFLYIFAAIPIHNFISHSVNIEAPVLAFASLALACSVRLFSPIDPPRRRFPRAAFFAGLCIGITGSLLTKFSGIVTMSIPLLAALGAGKTRSMVKVRTAWIALAVCIALLAPYYVTRNVQQSGRLFPLNTDWLLRKRPEVIRAHIERAAHPLQYVVRLLSIPTVYWKRGLSFRDYRTMRLADTWRDLWMRDHYLGKQPRWGSQGLRILFG